MKTLNCSLSDLRTPVVSSKSLLELLGHGKTKEKYNVSEQKVDTEDTLEVASTNSVNDLFLIDNLQEKEYATVECQPLHKKKIYKDKLRSLDATTLLTELSLIQDQVSTSKEKDLTPFWTLQSEELSKKLWLPTEIDCVDSVLNSSSVSLKTTLTEKSWFSINNKHPHKQNLQTISSPSSLFSLRDYTDLEVMGSRKKSKNSKTTITMRTMKIRILPTQKEKEQLKTTMEQFRWYYNSVLSIWQKKVIEEGKLRQYSDIEVRDWLHKYDYTERKEDDTVIIEYTKKNDDSKNIFKPEWWKEKNQIHSRLPRGAAKKITQNINSAVSNVLNKNIKDFTLKPMTKKSDMHIVSFEDKSFPSMIKNIKSVYSYTSKDRIYKTISFEDILNQQKKNKNKMCGCEVQYDTVSDRYYLYYPVEVSFYPETDRRIESQDKYCLDKDNLRMISLDPGIRKFLVGYDPSGKMVFIGEGAANILLDKLLIGDKTIDRNEVKRQNKNIRNKVDEMHWKTISYLIRNYDIILLPEYNTSQMIRGRKLNRKTKRMMNVFSNYKFKQRLLWKCSLYNKRIIIVDESYTSKTCTSCGYLNNVGGSEVYKCKNCNIVIDRDCNGARNILIKNKDNTQFTCNI